MSRLQEFWRENWLTALVIAILVVAYLALRTRPSAMASVDEFNRNVASRQATIVEFYSNT